jgi:hypothetical protein
MFGVRIVQVPQYCRVAEAIEEVVNPLRQLINEHQNKIKSLENDNNQLKEHVKSSIASVED